MLALNKDYIILGVAVFDSFLQFIHLVVFLLLIKHNYNTNVHEDHFGTISYLSFKVLFRF